MTEFSAKVVLGESLTLVGQLRFTQTGPRQFSTFSYDPTWMKDPHSIVLSHGNPLNFQRKFFLCAIKSRLPGPSEISALDFKHKFGRSAVCSVSATVDNDRSIF